MAHFSNRLLKNCNPQATYSGQKSLLQNSTESRGETYPEFQFQTKVDGLTRTQQYNGNYVLKWMFTTFTRVLPWALNS